MYFGIESTGDFNLQFCSVEILVSSLTRSESNEKEREG